MWQRLDTPKTRPKVRACHVLWEGADLDRGETIIRAFYRNRRVPARKADVLVLRVRVSEGIGLSTASIHEQYPASLVTEASRRAYTTDTTKAIKVPGTRGQ